MGLSDPFIDAHIQAWENWLRGRAYPHRVRWPAHLFHHAPLENAISILNAGLLRSRVELGDAAPCDVAGEGVIHNRHDAHYFVRLYFRPCTPTQFSIEGIRKPSDCAYGLAAHAPILVMFVFNAKSVLRQPDVRFSDRNMQLNSATIGSDEAYFRGIPFEKVYHQGGIAGDRSIIDHRCAEVLASSPLDLQDCLVAICCRSSAEKETLLHMLEPNSATWEDRILISDDLRVFERKFPFVQEVMIGPDGLIFQLNPRADNRTIDLSVRVWDALGQEVINFRNESISPRPVDAIRWRIARDMQPGAYRVEIKIEGHLAYSANVTLADSLF